MNVIGFEFSRLIDNQRRVGTRMTGFNKYGSARFSGQYPSSRSKSGHRLLISRIRETFLFSPRFSPESSRKAGKWWGFGVLFKKYRSAT
jgi:hypothetical protein